MPNALPARLSGLSGLSAELPLPKYHQIYLILREQLHEGAFADGLPGELALMEQFAVARITIRRALQQLVDEGLITREPGRGTRPVNPGITPLSVADAAEGAAGRQDGMLSGLLENLVAMGLRTSVNVLDLQKIPASRGVARALQMNAGEMVQKAVRLRSTREGPLSYMTTYVPAHLVPQLGRRELARKPILLLLEEAGVRVGKADQTISAKLADAVVARHLDIAVGSALLSVNRLVFDEQERPVQLLHGLYRPDRYEYHMQLSRIGGIDAKVWVNKEMPP